MTPRPWRFAALVATSLAVAACQFVAPAPTPGPSAAGQPTAGASGSVPTSPSGSASPSAPASSVAPAGSPGQSPLAIDPSRFVARVDNPWYPLLPGTTLRYSGIKDGEHVTEVFQVTADTIVIAGVRCVVVQDNLYSSGVLIERTTDWFAQDVDGNVWYFGEDTAELEDGKVVSTEGSWMAGVDGAMPGIFMPVAPAVGQSFQQEVFPNHAEDRFVILQIGIPVKVKAGTYDGAMLTAEWTELEPDVISTKTYVRGIGEVAESDIAGGDERLELVRIVRP